MNHHRHNRGGMNAGVVFVIIIPATFFLALFAALGWFAAVAGARYKVVKAFLFPMIWTITQFVGALLMVTVVWFIFGVIFQSKAIANYIFDNIANLSLLSMVFGDKRTTSVIHIIIYQLILWWFIGRPLTRHITLSIYDWAIQTIGLSKNIHPYDIREEIRRTDEAYRDADDVYKDGKPPLLGLILVGLASRTPVAQYY